MQRVNCFCCKIIFIVIALKNIRLCLYVPWYYFSWYFLVICWFFQVFKKKKRKKKRHHNQVELKCSLWPTLPKFYEIIFFSTWHVISNSVAFWQEPVRLLSTITLRNSKWCSVSSLTVRLAMALIRRRICAGWSEPLIVSHTTLLEIFIYLLWWREATLQGLSQLNTISTVAFTTHKTAQLTCCLRYVND